MEQLRLLELQESDLCQLDVPDRHGRAPGGTGGTVNRAGKNGKIQERCGKIVVLLGKMVV